MSTSPSAQLLRLTGSEIAHLHVLFLGKFPPKSGAPPPPKIDPDVGRERLTKWEVYNALETLGLRLSSLDNLDDLRTYAGPANYVFCLYNRENIRNPETVVASVCTQLGLPYLGAPPNIRALAEDKYLTKSVAAMNGLPVSPGAIYTDPADLAVPPGFEGPYFAKRRFGANSEGIDTDAMQPDWARMRPIVAAMIEGGEEVLVEPLLSGRDITVTVLAGTTDLALTPTLFRSELPHGIATEQQKRLLAGGRTGEPLDEPELAEVLKAYALRFASRCKPFDYMRVDFRQTLPDGRIHLLECNLTSNLGTHAATGIAIKHDGISHLRLIEHLVAYSTRRQGV